VTVTVVAACARVIGKRAVDRDGDRKRHENRWETSTGTATTLRGELYTTGADCLHIFRRWTILAACKTSNRGTPPPHARDVRSNRYEVAILPWAHVSLTISPPLRRRRMQSEGVCDRVCAEAAKLGAKVIQLPTIPYGVQSNMFGLTNALPINVYPATLFAFLRDIVDSLERQGIRKLVLFNCIGGNDFLKPFIREMAGRSEMFLCVVNWWQVGKESITTSSPSGRPRRGNGNQHQPGAHPELVRMPQAGTAPKPTRFERHQQRMGQHLPPWHLLTESTGSGDPRGATREKGEKSGRGRPRIAKFVAELSAADAKDGDFRFE
jgi:creatinine amidohydrolase